MIFYSVCAKKTYKKTDGTESKPFWAPVGTLKKNDDGKMYLELNMLPGVTYYVFPPKDKEESSAFGS